MSRYAYQLLPITDGDTSTVCVCGGGGGGGGGEDGRFDQCRNCFPK